MPRLDRDIRCSWNPDEFHPPGGNNLREFQIRLKIAVWGNGPVGWYLAHESSDIFVYSTQGDQDDGVQLATVCVTVDEGKQGAVLFSVHAHDPPIKNLSPPPGLCDVYYGDPGSGPGGFNAADIFFFEDDQELIDGCSLAKWHIPKPV